jgi:hypothetical protein
MDVRTSPLSRREGFCMKKILFIAIIYTVITSSILYANTKYDLYLKDKYPQAKAIDLIDNIDCYYLYIVVDEPNWWSKAIIYNSKTNSLSDLSIEEQSVYSARIVKTLNSNIVEIVGLTHMGNGKIHLFNLDSQLLFYSLLFR